MTSKGSQDQADQVRRPGIARTVLSDLRSKETKHSVRRDLSDLYTFYIDREKRAKLRGIKRVIAWTYLPIWLLKSLVLNLSPARRLLVLLGLLLAYIGKVSFSVRGLHFQTDSTLFAFVILLLVLMLELKDKLLARNEIMVARAVQLALLPKRNPSLPGWDIWLFSRPSNEVCGDMVDYIMVGDKRLGLTLADVSGKGLGAALLMTKLQAAQRALSQYLGSPSEMGAHLNHIFWEDAPRGKFATLVHLDLEDGQDRVQVLNAGHIPPVVIRSSKIERLDPVALPLGVSPDACYPGQSIDLGLGDMLLAYSDGLTEASNKHEEFYGDDRLSELLPQLRGLSAEAAGTRIVSEIQRFIGREPPSDDLSLILLKRVE